MSRIHAVTCATMTLFAALLWGAPAAGAHSALVSSDPAKGQVLEAAPERVALVFNEPVETGFAEIVVTGPDRNSQWQTGGPAISGTSVSTALVPLGPAGEYTISYRVVSADGHPVSGSLAFSMAIPSHTPAAAAQTDGPPAPAVTKPPRLDLPVWLWISGAVALLGAGFLVAWRISAPSPRESK